MRKPLQYPHTRKTIRSRRNSAYSYVHYIAHSLAVWQHLYASGASRQQQGRKALTAEQIQYPIIGLNSEPFKGLPHH
ncbi:hypothetical protein [Serratia quinivorans]|uniref:hypothetical protein n=1 Tax=Serratia quinivorans TaxID=137545 RepID=UPI0021BB8897|nr:hypothetical protein [Serratia quinivorans]